MQVRNKLSIRRFKPTDLEALYELLSDVDVMQYIEPPFTREQTQHFLESAGLSEVPLIYAVCEEGSFIGYVIFHDYDPDCKEIGWVLRRDAWGKGYAKILTKKLIGRARADKKSAIIEFAPEQAVSRHIAEKSGFRYTASRDGCDVYKLEYTEKPRPEKMHIIHPIPPTYDANSEILILGSFPSAKSREMMYFYGHPQNRFWKLLAAIFEKPVPMTVEERKKFLLENHVAVWDVIGECDIIGSSDSTIENAVPNDLTKILETADIRNIFVNGRKAEQMFIRYQEKLTGRKAICLPSTSPANAAWSLERLTEAWKIIKA